MKYKIFCDESNHLDYKDNPTLKSNIMVLGAIRVAEEEVEQINKHIKYLKHKHNYHKELKWTKLHISQKPFYDELLDFFFSEVCLKFQALLIPSKKNLKHDIYNDGSADLFYYKMFYYVFRNLFEAEVNVGEKIDAKIYLDYKDSRCGTRMQQLKEVLQSKYKDNLNVEVFTAKSHESNIIQLVDLLIGAIAYQAREDLEHKSEIKNYIVNILESKLYNKSLKLSTPPWESKFNIFKIELGKGK
ncbi:DUF3800 domain-containing protein [Helicobacter sp. 23-1046]